MAPNWSPEETLKLPRAWRDEVEQQGGDDLYARFLKRCGGQSERSGPNIIARRNALRNVWVVTDAMGLRERKDWKVWNFDDTSRLLRVWEDLIARSEKKEFSTTALMDRFEQLSDGGHSGLAVNTIKVKRYTLIYAHKFITELFTMNGGGEDADSKKKRPSCNTCDKNKAVGGTEGGVTWREERARAWFEMSSADRRKAFVTLYRVAHDYVHPTREQFDVVTRIKRAQPDVWDRMGKTMSRLSPGGSFVDPIQAVVANGVDSAMEHADRRTGWTHSDTDMLLHAWEAMIAKSTQVTRLSILREFHRLTNSDRPEPVITRKYRAIPNVHGVIMDHSTSIDV